VVAPELDDHLVELPFAEGGAHDDATVLSIERLS